MTDTTAFNTKGGTQSYMAPEILNYLSTSEGSEEYTNAVDIWAVGCIVYRLITGGVPFPPGKSLIRYCDDKSLFPYDALFDSGIRSEGSRFLRQLLRVMPHDRPTASEALKHPWVIANTQCTRMVSLRRSISKAVTGRSPKLKPPDVEVQVQDISMPSEPTQLTVSDAGCATRTHNGLRSMASFSTVRAGFIVGRSQLEQESSSTIRRKPVTTSLSAGTIRAITPRLTSLPAPQASASDPIFTSAEPVPWQESEYSGTTGRKLVSTRIAGGIQCIYLN